MSLKAATKLENGRVELEIEVGAEAFEAAVAKAYKKNIGKLNVPGFRKGKAPRHLVEKLYGEGVFYDEAMNDVYPEALDEAIKESGYEYVEDKIDLDVVSVGKEGLVFKAVITVKPEVTLGEYKGLKAPKAVKEVTDEDIAAELTKLQERNSRMVTVEDRAAADGDTVVFDFEGFVDEVAFDGGKAEKYSLVLGSGQFIPGFEEQIVGKSIDEEFDVVVTFPEDYQAEELAGKEAVFKCKLHEIKVKELPVLDDDFAKDCSEFDTLEELKADIKDRLTKANEKAAEDAFETALLDQLADGMQAEIPEAMIKNRVQDHVRDFAYRLQSQGLDLETYFKYTGMDMETFEEGFREQAERQVRVRLALEAVVKAEGIEVTEEDLEAEYTKMSELYKMDVEQIKNFVPAADLSRDIAVDKALQVIKDAAVITEE
ncbi:MAG: trigger factor [Ruminococcaceae bacterium]|nr:trigger factor [Oscillospiraceae bacterium]